MRQIPEEFRIGDCVYRPKTDENDDLEGCRDEEGLFERCDECVVKEACPMWGED